LRLTGFFPTRPQQINFDLILQVVAGQWQLLGISIATLEAAQPSAAAPAQPQAQATPVQQPTKFVLAINLITAKELGLVPSASLLAIADEVIK